MKKSRKVRGGKVIPASKDRVRLSLLMWWARTYAVLEEARRSLEFLCSEIEPKSPLASMIDSGQIGEVAGHLDQAAMAFIDAVPRLGVIPNPLEGVPIE